MAAFLGDCVQCLGVVKGKHTFLPYCGYLAEVSPQEQGKLKILTFVGMLESYGEIPGDVPHYTARAACRALLFLIKGNRTEILFDLYKSFDHESQA